MLASSSISLLKNTSCVFFKKKNTFRSLCAYKHITNTHTLCNTTYRHDVLTTTKQTHKKYFKHLLEWEKRASYCFGVWRPARKRSAISTRRRIVPMRLHVSSKHNYNDTIRLWGLWPNALFNDIEVCIWARPVAPHEAERKYASNRPKAQEWKWNALAMARKIRSTFHYGAACCVRIYLKKNFISKWQQELTKWYKKKWNTYN